MYRLMARIHRVRPEYQGKEGWRSLHDNGPAHRYNFFVFAAPILNQFHEWSSAVLFEIEVSYTNSENKKCRNILDTQNFKKDIQDY